MKNLNNIYIDLHKRFSKSVSSFENNSWILSNKKSNNLYSYNEVKPTKSNISNHCNEVSLFLINEFNSIIDNDLTYSPKDTGEFENQLKEFQYSLH